MEQSAIVFIALNFIKVSKPEGNNLEAFGSLVFTFSEYGFMYCTNMGVLTTFYELAWKCI